ncbi:MAG: beta-xylosidase [Bacteroidales bacterium]|nr:beta-xylosidase [Bacteroidales bacterium]
MKSLSCFLLTLPLIISCKNPVQPPESSREIVYIQINLEEEIGPMNPSWAWFGYDEPNYTYMKDGRKLLSEIAALSPVPVYIRAHNLLTSGDGTPALKWGSTNAYTEDENGNPVYDWTIIDKIFDTYIERGMKPFVEIGFMPEALSVKPEPYKHSWKPGAKYEEIYTGWAYPPKDYNTWAELVYQWVLHSVERYGREEVETWYWELWNEPNIGYWQGSLEEYLKLYDYTADAIKRALPTAIMGGPNTTGPSWEVAAEFLTAFLNHIVSGKNHVTGKTGAPLDFIAFHAKGQPTLVDSTIQMNMGTQLRDISKGFEIVASFPELKHLPVIIGECDPEGCAACSMQDYPQNAYRNGTLYPSYTAASFARIYALADHFGVNLKGLVTWAFEFEGQPWFNGYRDLATNGVDKPVLNVFRMYGMMNGRRVEVSGDLAYDYISVRDSGVRGDKPDINALAVVNDSSASIMVWNYHDLNVIRPETAVMLTVKGIPAKKVTLTHYRIDHNNSNSYEVWKNMGSPQEPTPEQYAGLEKAGMLKLLSKPLKIKVNQGISDINISLPGQAVSLIKLEWLSN